MQRRIKYGLRKWMKACFGPGREPPRAHQNYVGESESQNPAQLESEISVHPIDSFKADSFQKRFDLGEKLANETPYEEEAAAEAGMGPDPPAWFRWSPAMEGGMWPKKMDFQATVGNTSDCKASFWCCHQQFCALVILMLLQVWSSLLCQRREGMGQRHWHNVCFYVFML